MRYLSMNRGPFLTSNLMKTFMRGSLRSFLFPLFIFCCSCALFAGQRFAQNQSAILSVKSFAPFSLPNDFTKMGFTWTEVPGAVSYKVQVSSNPTFVPLAKDVLVPTGNSTIVE